MGVLDYGRGSDPRQAGLWRGRPGGGGDHNYFSKHIGEWRYYRLDFILSTGKTGRS